MNNSTSTNEVQLSGVSGAPGIALGKASVYLRPSISVSQEQLTEEEVDQQLQVFEEALADADEELQILLNDQENEDVARLLQAQVAMINDPELHEQVKNEIRTNRQPADAAVDSVFGMYLELMNKNRKSNLQEQSVDISDVRDRLVQILHHDKDLQQIKEGAIVVAKQLSPREVIEFDQRRIQGIIMEGSGRSSHSAILARALQIPTIVGVKNAFDTIETNRPVVLDANQGKVIVGPSAQTRQQYDEKKRNSAKQWKRENIHEQSSKTADGCAFTLRANIGFAKELSAVQACGAEGIGLLRTESVYLDRSRFGSEQSQRSFYQTVMEQTGPHPVTMRLFDAGGDKLFNAEQQEQNPFLGWRGIRMLLDKSTLFERQLRAILRMAGQFPGRIRLLVPMVSTLDEVQATKEAIQNIQNQLVSESIDIDPDVPLGIMVEIPNVALFAQQFAEQVDFLSIGTNDLTQYLLAVDRGNERIADLYNQRHPALWRMIKQVAEAGRLTQTPVSVCGELASNPAAACGLLGLGISELSMSPSALSGVKKMLRSNTLKAMQQLAADILQSTTVAEVEKILTNFK